MGTKSVIKELFQHVLVGRCEANEWPKFYAITNEFTYLWSGNEIVKHDSPTEEGVRKYEAYTGLPIGQYNGDSDYMVVPLGNEIRLVFELIHSVSAYEGVSSYPAVFIEKLYGKKWSQIG